MKTVNLYSFLSTNLINWAHNGFSNAIKVHLENLIQMLEEFLFSIRDESWMVRSDWGKPSQMFYVTDE